jgi:hypothetical protein
MGYIETKKGYLKELSSGVGWSGLLLFFLTFAGSYYEFDLCSIESAYLILFLSFAFGAVATAVKNNEVMAKITDEESAGVPQKLVLPSNMAVLTSIAFCGAQVVLKYSATDSGVLTSSLGLAQPAMISVCGFYLSSYFTPLVLQNSQVKAAQNRLLMWGEALPGRLEAVRNQVAPLVTQYASPIIVSAGSLGAAYFSGYNKSALMAVTIYLGRKSTMVKAAQNRLLMWGRALPGQLEAVYDQVSPLAAQYAPLISVFAGSSGVLYWFDYDAGGLLFLACYMVCTTNITFELGKVALNKLIDRLETREPPLLTPEIDTRYHQGLSSSVGDIVEVSATEERRGVRVNGAQPPAAKPYVSQDFSSESYVRHHQPLGKPKSSIFWKCLEVATYPARMILFLCYMVVRATLSMVFSGVKILGYQSNDRNAMVSGDLRPVRSNFSDVRGLSSAGYPDFLESKGQDVNPGP